MYKRVIIYVYININIYIFIYLYIYIFIYFKYAYAWINFIESDNISHCWDFQNSMYIQNNSTNSKAITITWNISNILINTNVLHYKNIICIECNLITLAYSNDKCIYMIHKFSSNMPSEYRIFKIPAQIVYLRIIKYHVFNDMHCGLR
jgi:hypothetical protein